MNLYLLKTAVEAAIIAGKKILDVYNSKDFEVTKKSDNSPLTKADLAAHNIIKTYLTKTNYPILSEEGRNIPHYERKDWAYFWLVDPLDGTKEFINRNGEFTVNIAFVRNQSPILGVVYIPFSGDLYFADYNLGSFRDNITASENINEQTIEDIINTAVKLPLVQSNDKFTIVGSRSHMSPETEEFISHLKNEYKEIEMISKGSALKLCMVAEGTADIYPRFGPTMEWDTGAGHAIVNFSGGSVYLTDSETPLKYNKEDLTNPWFIASR